MDYEEIISRMLQDQNYTDDFSESDEYLKAFEEWAIRVYPEEFGND